MNREGRRRQQVVVHSNGRHRDAAQHQRGVLGNLHARGADAARGDQRAGSVEECNLPELAELQDVILEDAILLPLLQARVLEVRGERLEELGIGRDVAADFFGGARRDVQVAADNRIASAALQRENRHEAVDEERDDG